MEKAILLFMFGKIVQKKSGRALQMLSLTYLIAQIPQKHFKNINLISVILFGITGIILE